MKWLEWISGWFGGTTKSLSSLGVGLRVALSGGAPGGWASDHREETVHNTGFNYIAIHAIAAQVAGATVTVFSDGEQRPLRQSRRKSLASRAGSFARWKSTYGADDRETDPLPLSHPLVQLLKRPNPYESGANFRYRQAQQIRLTGTCLVWNVPGQSGPTCERYVVPTSMASPVSPTNELPCGGWRISPVASRYTSSVDEGFVDCPSWYRILGQIVDARQVQVIRLPNAWYLDDGQSPLSAGAKWIDASDAVDTARYHQLKNGIDPSVVWNLPPDVSPDQDEIDRVQAKISAKYGGPENVGRVMIAQNGTSVTPLTTSPKDMCYTEGFQDFKSAVLALHQTPPVAVGLQEPGAYAAYNASMKAWRHAAIQPLCDMLAESDTEYMAPQFGAGLTVEIESDTVDDLELTELQLQNDLAAKVRTKNEWRAVRGLPPLPSPQGDALVGTDTPPDQSHPSNSTSDEAIKSSAMVQSNTSSMTLGQPSSIGPNRDRFKHHDNFSSESDENDAADSKSPDEEDSIRTNLIAEILFGLYGPSAISVLESIADHDAKSFDASLHPRDDRGRFTARGSTDEIAAAQQFISQVLQGDLFDRTDPRALQAFRSLTVPQLQTLHREHGIKIPPRFRSQLVELVSTRLLHGPDSPGRGESPFANVGQSKPGYVDVFVQHEDQLNGILERTMKKDHWSRLVGALPGARVYVHPAGIRSVGISVEHPDYSARRIVRPTQIFNASFEVDAKKQGQGIGSRVLAQQIKTAIELKFDCLKTDAAGIGKLLRDSPEIQHESGYYAWARLGYDGPIAPLMRQRLAEGNDLERATVRDFRRRFPGVKRVSEMMLTKERRDWWLNYGGSFYGTFSLQPKSTSLKIHRDYLAEKALFPVAKSSQVWKSSGTQVAAMAQFPAADSFKNDRLPVPNVEMPDRLTPEDDLILDRIWDRIGQVTLGKPDLNSAAASPISDPQS